MSTVHFITNQEKLLSDIVKNILPSLDIPIKALLAILNFRLINWYYHSLVEEIGRAIAEVKIVNLKKLPISIYAFDVKNNQALETFVDQIFSAKKKDPQADTSAQEKQIDQMVYKLYNLTPDEIAIVEGKG